jgi:Ca2+-binding EF-hand superfamily protein
MFLRSSRLTASSTKGSTGVSRKPQLSPLKEHSPSRPKQQFTRGGASGGITRGKSSDGPSTSSRHVHVTPAPSHYDHTSIGEAYGIDAGFSQAEIQELRESFQLFDMSNSGSIRVGDLRTTLGGLVREQRNTPGGGFSSSPPTYANPRLTMLLNQLMDLPDDEVLTLDAYIDLMATTLTIHQDNDNNGGAENRNHFAPVFRLFDTEGRGYLTVEDLERVAIELGEYDMTRGELEEMIIRARSQQDGRVGLQEFTRMMTLPLFPRGEVDGQES